MLHIKQILKDCGLTKQDTILVQANVVNWVRTFNCSVRDIVDAFTDVVGTLVVPVFNTDWNNGVPFDFHTTPSRMGVFSECVRKMGAVRSGHPSYGFCAIGDKSHLFNINNYSGYGKDSPFAVLRRIGGKVGVLGLVNNQGNTLFHHVEELHQVPYRFYKRFTGKYTDRHGNTEERTYGFYCNGGVYTLLNPIDDLLWKEGLYTGCKPYDGHGFRVIDANRMFDFVWNIIEQGKAKGLLYENL